MTYPKIRPTIPSVVDHRPLRPKRKDVIASSYDDELGCYIIRRERKIRKRKKRAEEEEED